MTGLLLILGSVLILTVINPDILNVRFLTNERTRVGSNEVGDAAQGDGRVVKTVEKGTSCGAADTGYTFAGEAVGSNSSNKSCVYTKNPTVPDGIRIIENGVVKIATYAKEDSNIVIEVHNSVTCPPSIPLIEGTQYRPKGGRAPEGSTRDKKKCIYVP